MAILNTEYQDVLGINPKYNKVIDSSLTLKGCEVFQAVVNKCAYNILHYDEIKARAWHEYTFGIRRNKAGEFAPSPFTAHQIVCYCNVPAPGATMTKLISLGLLVKHSKTGGVCEYRIPYDLFTTNDLSIKFYNPDIPQF